MCPVLPYACKGYWVLLTSVRQVAEAESICNSSLRRDKPLATCKVSRAQVLFSSTFLSKQRKKYNLPLRGSWQTPRDKKDGERKGEEEDVSVRV